MKIVIIIVLALVTVIGKAQYTDTVPDIDANCLRDKSIDSLVIDFANDSVYISGILQANCMGPWSLVRYINQDTIILTASDDCLMDCMCPLYFNTVLPDFGFGNYWLTIGYRCSSGTEYIYHDTIINNSSIGIYNPHRIRNFIKVYPNPTYEKCKIELVNSRENIITVKVFSLTKRLLTQVVNKSFLNEISMDLKGLQPGVYLIQINTDKKQYFKKIIKQ